MLTDMNEIKTIIENSKTIAIVGLSPKENRPSNMVGRYLQDAGYTIIPVNPGQQEILGETCYASLTDIPVAVDVVDIFRRSEDVEPIVDEAIAIGAGAVWMQQGVINEAAAEKGRQAGLRVVMDRCLKIDHFALD